MGANNFVSRLTKEDFLKFIGEHYDINKFSESDMGIVQLPTFDGDTNPTFRVTFKSRKKIGKIPDPMIFYFNDFYYEKGFLHNYFDVVFWPNKRCWRKFMAEKFGVDYISAYETFVNEYYENERKRIESIKKESDGELEKLVSMFAGN